MNNKKVFYELAIYFNKILYEQNKITVENYLKAENKILKEINKLNGFI